MSRKLKFKPVISRVKLNPEQAVLTCSGYAHRWEGRSEGPGTQLVNDVCDLYPAKSEAFGWGYLTTTIS